MFISLFWIGFFVGCLAGALVGAVVVFLIAMWAMKDSYGGI